MDSPTFNGGAGNDNVVSMDAGTFNGAVGDDSVDNLHGGTFNGGPGIDTVGVFNGGTFNPVVENPKRRAATSLRMHVFRGDVAHVLGE